MTLSYILSMIHDGQWFGFSDSKNQTYENLIILDSQYTKPTEDEIETKKVELENEISNRLNARKSAINKLKGATYSAVTDAEAKALFGDN